MAGILYSKSKSTAVLLTYTAILLLTVLIPLVSCSEITDSSVNFVEIYSQVDRSNTSCETLYQYYLHMIDSFTQCELKHAQPFRLCINCTVQFEVVKAVYTNLTEEPRHIDCKIKYMQSDRVQVIPTVQANMEDIWTTAHCQNCYSYKPDGLESGQITYHEDVKLFLDLYENFSNCVNISEQEYVQDLRTLDGNLSSKCSDCSKNYSLLNEHYKKIYTNDSGDVCMDLMDRMNFTRMLWSLHLHCTHRDGNHDFWPVIIISCVVGCTPIIFYVSLRVTGKVGRKKIYEQKRFRSRKGTTHDNQGNYAGIQGAGGDTGTSRGRNTTAD